MPSEDHYSSYCHLCLNNELNLETNKIYYYDGLINNGKIELVFGDFSNKLNYIIKFNIFIVLYIKNN